MNVLLTLTHKFVDTVPDILEEGVLYVSIRFKTVIHKCCCGCGNQVVTPLSPSDWKLTFDGRSISLHPSIGNWKFSCRSHYWIKGNRIEWVTQETQEIFEAGKAYGAVAKDTDFNTPSDQVKRKTITKTSEPAQNQEKYRVFQKIKRLLKKWRRYL